MRRPNNLLPLALLICIQSSRLEAQATTAAALAFGGLDKLLDRVESISLYYGGQVRPSSDRIPWSKEFGLEFSFHVGQSGEDRPESKKVQEDKPKRDPVTSITIKTHVTGDGANAKIVGVDTEVVTTPRKKISSQVLDYDLAIAYGQLDGIKMTTPYEVRGYVRELPAVTLYATFRPPTTGFWSNFGVYSGARLGVISLQDAQLFVPTNDMVPVVTLSATTFEAGVPFGIEWMPFTDSGARLTVEGAYTRRQFNSLSYNPGKGFPTNVPHSVDVSGWGMDVGISFPIPKK